MAMSVGSSGGYKAEINITPLVDVVLVLLIIFMVLTPLVQMGYDLQIPRKVENTQPDISQQADQVILTVTQGSPTELKIYINKEEVPKGQLEGRLNGIYKGKIDKVMFLSAERRVAYGQVMEIVDIARKAGGENLKIGLVTEDKVGPPGGETVASAAIQ